MVELRTWKTEMRGYRGNHHEKLGPKIISCASQFTIPDTAGMSPDPECNYTDTRSSQPNPASHTPGYSYPLVSSPSFSSSSPISLFLVHNSTIIAEHKVKSSVSILPCHDHELALSIAYTEYSMHRVQHTPSTAYTEFSIHQVQHPSKIVCLPFILSITSWALNVASASGVSLHVSWEVKSHCPIPVVASELTDEKSLRTRCTGHRLPPSTRPNSLDYVLQVHSQTCSITASKFALWWRTSASTHWLDHCLQVHLQTCSITAFNCISILARLRPRSASPNSLDHSLQMHLYTRLIAASKCISKLPRSWPPKCNSKLNRSRPAKCIS